MMQKVILILDAIPPPVHLQSRSSTSHTLVPTCRLARRCRSRLTCRSQVKEHNFIQGSSLEIGPTRRLSTPCHRQSNKPLLARQSRFEAIIPTRKTRLAAFSLLQLYAVYDGDSTATSTNHRCVCIYNTDIDIPCNADPDDILDVKSLRDQLTPR